MKEKFLQIGKFALWFGLIMTSLAVIAAIALPLGVIATDYLGGSSFPVGVTVTAGILAIGCLTLFVRSLRQIQTNPIVIASTSEKKPKRIYAKDSQVKYRGSRKIEPQFNLGDFTENKINQNNVLNFEKANGGQRIKL